MKIVDAQGQPCPIPVVRAKEALAAQDAQGVVVLVDNLVAVQNLEKMARGTGCTLSVKEEGGRYTVTILKDGSGPFDKVPGPQGAAPGMPEAKGPVVLITADRMGRGAEDLGKLLIKGFIFSLAQLNPPPEAVIFLNSGAQLTTEGANTIPDLKALEAKGVGVYTCGTCANYYQLTEALAVGSIVDMMTIVNRLAQASSVITL